MSEFFIDGGHDHGGALHTGGDMGGMDHHGHDHHGFNHQHGADQALGGPSTTPAWNGAFRGVKFSDIIQGINVTPNFMLAMLFIGFTAWLFVVYWIRHNEPFANQVLGTPNSGAPTANADRILVEGAKNALPIRTSAKTGSFYTPDKKWRQSAEAGAAIGAPAAFGAPNGSAYGAPPVIQSPNAIPSHARVIRNGRETVVVANPEPLAAHAFQQQSHPRTTYAMSQGRQIVAQPAQQPMTSAPAAYGSPYRMPEVTQGGARMKVVVNR